MATIRWTLGARQDFQELVTYVAQDSSVYAAILAERILTAVERIRGDIEQVLLKRRIDKQAPKNCFSLWSGQRLEGCNKHFHRCIRSFHGFLPMQQHTISWKRIGRMIRLHFRCLTRLVRRNLG